MSDKAPEADVVSARAPKPVGLYPHAKRAGNLLFLSGIGPREPGTDRIPGNVRHRVVALEEPVKALDIFYPIREDYR